MKVLAVQPLIINLSFISLLFLTGAGCGENLSSKNKKLQAEIEAMRKEIQFIRAENGRLRELNGEPLEIGFEIQIAAFENFSLSVYADELVRFHEKKEYSYNKYILGQFSQYEDAKVFLQDVHNMGLKDAFIAGIVDGKRSSVRLAREASEKYYGKASESISDWDEP